MSNEWVTVCQEEDLVSGSGICVLFGEQQIAIFHESKKGKLYAISNFDPIGEANVLSRGIIGSIGDKTVVASPLYKQHFCLETGACLEDENMCVSTYAVTLQDGEVMLKKH
ncbi:MAG: nitrite reductase (NAD(P)H) small subunit [SAR86 cluster bacterium]|uniref:Nitrite reductase (NAD(P)H) small subunit n=1 Tax=SAR86 cluster bacterium TaxID=2030880 RepID=A0A2A5CH05_9GAMM|nr:MAG: nitrite reductase (NAD(P)H) small subunit [SAR86 cluster bacterium]